MTCGAAVRSLSAYRDRELPPSEARDLSLHLGDCGACSAHWNAYAAALDGLALLPRLASAEPVAARVFFRLDMENRKPGLAQLFRPFASRRPLMLPSLIPAVLVLAAVLGGALLLDDGPLPAVHYRSRTEAWDMSAPLAGTATNPLFPTDELAVPRTRRGQVPSYLLDQHGEGTLFVETVVAGDGTVSAVNVLHGDVRTATGVVNGLRRERFEPVRVHGRPVAVSVYRLISRMEVRPPIT